MPARRIACEELLPGLWRLADTCNVYVLQEGDRAMAVDFGSGRWLECLPKLGIRHLDSVWLTHSHEDQCGGLAQRAPEGVTIHAPLGDETYLDPAAPRPYPQPPWLRAGCVVNYLPPRTRRAGLTYDLAGNVHLYWGARRVRVVSTPGHTPTACSLVINHGGRQLVFCGDACHAGGTIWQPFHLEWDHWTGEGALAAWQGVERLAGMGLDLLCPAHGPVLSDRPRRTLQQLSRRLLAFYRAKGQISPGEPDRFVEAPETLPGVRPLLPHLYMFGGNGYLLVSESGEGLVVDPFTPDLPALEALLAELGVRPTAQVVSHYHYDHCDAIPVLRERYGARAWLHPEIARLWRDPAHTCAPWLLPDPITADHLWPRQGEWTWNEYPFKLAHWPGQTWGHCAFQTTVDGQRVLFGGDSFVPSSRWNGTGGFCAYNGSRFAEGFIPSARLALEWRPEIVANGHTNCYYYAATKFRKIIRWAEQAQVATTGLCPDGDLEGHYYSAAKIISRHAAGR
jgi:glyoxylase-like metal-dependent hydrolase (beta-lactamase superfamily II)